MSKKFFMCIVSVLCVSSFVFSQTKLITGTVSDADGPLVGVSIIVKNSTTGVYSDFDGRYSINANPDDVLVFSFLGMEVQEITVGNQNTINVVMQEDAQALDEVIVTAQGISKSKKALGYAVSTVEGEELENKAESDVARSLQGKMAGVHINNPSGSTGATPSIRIRSNLSLTQSNAPLIVVDDVPFQGSLIDINPNDIEEMNVLKGLNASMLYGNRGRNGVILIQTKTGSGTLGKQRMSVDFSQTVYANKVANLPEFQNKYGMGSDYIFVDGNIGSWGSPYSEIDFVPHPYASQTDVFPEFAGVEIPYEPVPDNVKNFFKTGIGTVTALNIASSQEKTAFNMSLGYTQETGIMIGNNDLERFNVGVGGKMQVSKKLDIAATLNFSSRKRNSLSGTSAFERLMWIPRNLDIHNLPYQNPQTGAMVYYRPNQNPLWTIHNTNRNDDVMRTFGSLKTRYKFNDNISLSYRVGYDTRAYDEMDHSNRGGLGSYQHGYLNLDYSKRSTVDQTLMLNTNHALTDKIGLDAQIGINSEYYKGKSNSSRSTDQIVFGFFRPQNFRSTTASAARTAENFAGAFGQFEFSYDNYLYLSLSGRNDWGSTVEPEHRQLFYPGASISFIPTSAFKFGSNAINYLKIRGAYATSSGYPTRYRTRTILSTNIVRFTTIDGHDVVANRESSLLPNPDLTPELHKEVEVGIEGRFFNNRVTLDASAYKRISEDQILRRSLDRSTGFDATYTNVGRIDGEGLEIDLGIDIIKQKNGLRWNLRNIFTAYRTEVIDLGGTEKLDLGSMKYAIEGKPLGVLVGSYAMRDSEGNFIINPNNGILIKSYNLGLDERVIGDPNPDFRLTTINSISYKGFSLSAQFEYTHGGEDYSDLAEDLLERGITRDTENREGSYVLPGVLGDPSTGEPYLDANGEKIPNHIQLSGNRQVFANYYNAKDLSTFDHSVFRVRDITLGYKLNKQQIKRLPFESLSFSLSGRNIFYRAPGFPKYTNIDPEVSTAGGTTVPTTKRYAFGVALSF